MGFYDRPQPVPTQSWDDLSHNRVAADIARSGMVLLKNQKVLPLNRKKAKRLAVLGPNAHPAITGGGGASYTRPFRSTSIVEGLRAVAGDDVEIVHVPFPSPHHLDELSESMAFETTTSEGRTVEGLSAEYFSGTDLQGAPVEKRVDRVLRFDWSGRSPAPRLGREDFSARWTGGYTPSRTGPHQVVAAADDGVRVWLGDKLVIDDWDDHASRLRMATKDLEEGMSYSIRVEYYQKGGDASLKVGIQPSALDLSRIASADAAIVCVGFDRHTEGEGFDRTFELPQGQEQLILDVARRNKKTIVVLNAGGAVATEKWIGKVPALLHAWYGGQEGGRAAAEILFGDVNPSGKLPISWEKTWEDAAARGNYPGSKKKMHYREGIFVGYRHFDVKRIEPLFPFGFGLSYTNFAYGNLKVSPNRIRAGGKVTVQFQVANTGKVAGAEVAQVYLADPRSKLPRPLKELKGFVRVELKPKQKKRVSVTLDEAAMSYYDPDREGWTAEPGEFEVLVGPSSRDIKLRGEFTLTA
jgi:beta-glucosidase